jgi:predicted metal-dependent phosphoesterase TrpH
MNPNIVVKTAVQKGYDVLGIVDHNSIKGGLAAKKIAGEKLLVIPGEEIKTNYGEIIVFLSDGRYNRDLIDVCERAKEENHFIAVPHPFDFLRARTCLRNHTNKVKSLVDAIEVFNSRILINWFNEMAEKYAEKNNLPKIVGSDAHFLEEIGNATAFLKCDKNVDSVFKSIRKNNLKFNCKKSSLLPHFKTRMRKSLLL